MALAIYKTVDIVKCHIEARKIFEKLSTAIDNHSDIDYDEYSYGCRRLSGKKLQKINEAIDLFYVEKKINYKEMVWNIEISKIYQQYPHICFKPINVPHNCISVYRFNSINVELPEDKWEYIKKNFKEGEAWKSSYLCYNPSERDSGDIVPFKFYGMDFVYDYANGNRKPMFIPLQSEVTRTKKVLKYRKG